MNAPTLTRRSLLDQLETMAAAQRAYFARKQQEYPSLDDFLDEEGECKLPADIGPLLQQASANGRFSEADWWLSSIRALKEKEAVGEEVKPQAAWYEDSTGCFHMSLDVALIEANARDNGHEIHYLYGKPNAWLTDAADQDTRPRYSMKRMRDETAKAAERERLRFEGDLDRLMKAIGAGITGYQPEAYAVMDAACAELVTLRGQVNQLLIDVFAKETEANGYLKSVEQLQIKLAELSEGNANG